MEDKKHIEFDGLKWTLACGYYKRNIVVLLHRHVWEKHFGPIPKGYHIHHKDGNKLNNDISNLECLSASDHHKKTWDENYEKMCITTSRNFGNYKRSKAQRKKTSENSKKYWKYKQPTKLRCTICDEIYSTKQPELSKRCRKCQKKDHYENAREDRFCRICNAKFNCYKYSKIQTCCRSCGLKLAWKTKRGS